jgi:hypothetical protein
LFLNYPYYVDEPADAFLKRSLPTAFALQLQVVGLRE